MHLSVCDAIRAAALAGGNPSSIHGVGRAARLLIEQASEKIANYVGMPGARVIFCGGQHEAKKLAATATLTATLTATEEQASPVSQNLSQTAKIIFLSSADIGGPVGIYALILPEAVRLTSLWSGGGQQYGLRPGTQSTPLIAGMGVAAKRAENVKIKRYVKKPVFFA